MPTTTTRWIIEVDIDEFHQERCTHAVARLRRGDDVVQGAGSAHRHPRDPELASVGDQVAAARALIELASILHQDAELTLDKVGARPWPPEEL